MTPRLQFLLLILAALLCTSCAHGTFPRSARAGDQNARLVEAIWYNPRADLWQRSPWYRSEYDMVTPMRVVIGVDRFGCLMGNEVIEPQPRSYYVCPAGWRYPRTR